MDKLRFINNRIGQSIETNGTN